MGKRPHLTKRDKIMKNINIQDIEQVHVTARRWFQKSYGNTYHSVYLSVLLKGSDSYIDLGFEPFRYGYDRQYEQTALDLFYQCVDVPQKQDLESVKVAYLQTACQMLGIKYSEDVQDVSRKKDL